MRTPIRATPYAVERGAARFRSLRWLDALVAWLAAWATLAAALDVGPDAQAGLAAVATGLLALVPPIRVRWRPVSAWVGLAMSVRLGPGGRARCSRSGRPEPDARTGRRGFALL